MKYLKPMQDDPMLILLDLGYSEGDDYQVIKRLFESAVTQKDAEVQYLTTQAVAIYLCMYVAHFSYP